MAKGEITYTSDYTSVWEELNAARTRLGVPTIQVPEGVKGTAATNAQMENMEDAINSTRTSDYRISSQYPSPVTLDGIDTGNIMLYSIISNANNIAKLYQDVPICSCQGHQSDHNDNDRLQQCGCWGDDGCSGDSRGCEQNCDCYGTCDTY